MSPKEATEEPEVKEESAKEKLDPLKKSTKEPEPEQVEDDESKYDDCIKDCDKSVERGRELRADYKMVPRELTRKGTALANLAKCSKDYEPAIETSQKALAEHRNPDTLKVLNDAQKAKKELEQQEHSDPEKADEEPEKVLTFIIESQDSSCFVHSKNETEQGSDSTVFRNSHYINSSQFHPPVTYFPQPIRFYPPNLQFQHIALNQMTAPYPPHVQQNTSRLPLNGISSANTGSFEPQTLNPCKGSKKNGKISKASKNSHITQSNNQRRYWSNEEDIALTNAYLFVSVDSAFRKDQTSEKMWSRIFNVWKENMGSYDETRNINSLSCHWSIIQAAVNKFHGLYESLGRAPKSGTSVEDIKREAMKMYKDMGDGSSFKFEHCWEIMIKNKKWCSQQLTRTDSSKKQKIADSSFVATSSPLVTTTPGVSLSHGNDSMDAEPSPRTEIDGVAPDGERKNTKGKRKQRLEEKNMIAVLRNLQSTIEKQYTFNQEELELKREKDKRVYELQEETMKRELELKERALKLKEEAQEIKKKAQRRKEQERILNVNLNNLQPAIQVAYEKMQARILKEWEMEGLFRDIYDNDKAGV